VCRGSLYVKGNKQKPKCVSGIAAFGFRALGRKIQIVDS
jgi:hypothetical protein